MSEYLYIAGPMSGYENNNKANFIIAQRKMEMFFKKDNIFNPATQEPPKEDLSQQDMYRVCLELDLTWICKYATHMYMLKGWENSPGALIEHRLAVTLGLDIMYEM